MQLRLQFQQNRVADEVAALTAVIRPILEGTLYALKAEVAAEAGGHDRITLRMLSRLYRPGDGDCGLCFEYAVHDALNRRDAAVMDRIHDAAHNFCRVPGTDLCSLLFGLEKSGALNLIDTVKERLTEDSRLLTGLRHQPPKLRRHIDSVAAAFRKRAGRELLPWSISGLWKADLFVGYPDSDRWIGTTVKINPNDLVEARGLRLAIVPTRGGTGDQIRRDEQKNLVICPLPYDGSFMEVFYQGWGIVQQFIAADAQMPREVALPRLTDRQVAQYLVDRREFPVAEVLDALVPLSQPQLLRTEDQNAALVSRRKEPLEIGTGAVVAPFPSNP